MIWVKTLMIWVNATDETRRYTSGSMAKDQDNPFQTGHTELPANFVEPPEGFKPHYDPPRAQ